MMSGKTVSEVRRDFPENVTDSRRGRDFLPRSFCTAAIRRGMWHWRSAALAPGPRSATCDLSQGRAGMTRIGCRRGRHRGEPVMDAGFRLHGQSGHATGWPCRKQSGGACSVQDTEHSISASGHGPAASWRQPGILQRLRPSCGAPQRPDRQARSAAGRPQPEPERWEPLRSSRSASCRHQPSYQRRRTRR